MAIRDNRPRTEQLRSMLSGLGAKKLEKIDDGLLALLLGTSIADVQRKARTRFNARTRLEHRDGNGTSFLSLQRWPAQRILDLRVNTPILDFLRIYEPDEIELYEYQAQVRVYSWKMVNATISGQSIWGQSAWGTLFPPIPKSVHVTYAYGFAQIDVDDTTGLVTRTTFDGGQTWETGDTRHEQDEDVLTKLRMAALCDAAASYLAQIAGQSVGTVTAVSFDGFSKTLNPQAYGPQVQALVEQRDQLLERERRPYFATAGITPI